jgi:tetratricopeptide (TPR) repeat protein
VTVGEEARRFMRRDRWKEGRRSLEDAVRRAPSDAEARAHLGFFCVKESRYDVKRGLAEFEAALKHNPRCVTAYLYRAVTRAYLNQRALADEDVLSAERHGASEADLAWACGCVELEAGSPDLAAAWFGRLTELRPESSWFIMLAKSHYQAGRLEKAVEWLEKASAADREDFRPHVYRGIYLAFLKRYPEARRALERAEAMEENYALLHHTWAYVEQAEGNSPAAERRLREALKLDPDYVTSHKMLGDICAASAREEEARDHYRYALKLFPDYREAREALSQLEVRAK